MPDSQQSTLMERIEKAIASGFMVPPSLAAEVVVEIDQLQLEHENLLALCEHINHALWPDPDANHDTDEAPAEIDRLQEFRRMVECRLDQVQGMNDDEELLNILGGVVHSHERLQEHARRFYRADGSHELCDTADECVQKRIEAAKGIERLQREKAADLGIAYRPPRKP